MSLSFSLLDIIAPRRCVGCSVYDTWFCEVCRRACLRPQQEFFSDALSHQTGVSSVVAAGLYTHATWERAITRLKFYGSREIAMPMATSMAVAAQQYLVAPLINSQSLLVPVPLHTRRLRQRGYNQALELSLAINAVLGWPIADQLVQRAVYTKPQADLVASERIHNIANAFALQSGVHDHDWSAYSFVIVDDVVTTGATVTALARTLSALHPAAIHVLAAVRGG